MWAHLAKIALPEQALIPGQVDESAVPWLDPHPPPGRRAPFPPGLAAVGLVDSEHWRLWGRNHYCPFKIEVADSRR
jgi:hypothetical protein